VFFTRKGIWTMFGLALVGGSASYFIIASTIGGTWIPWTATVLGVLFVVFSIILWLKLLYIFRIGMDGSVDWDDPKRLPLRRQNGVGLKQEECCNCSILLWEASIDDDLTTKLIIFFTGFSGFSHVSVDCCLYDPNDGTHYMIESTVKENAGIPPHELNGPQYGPIDAYRDSSTGKYRSFRRVPIGNLIDCKKFCACLRKQVDDAWNGKIDHKEADLDGAVSMILGTDEPNRVTCSGLVARCIQANPGSKLDRKLEHALNGRLIGGEITPSDIARARYR
jgi:hypothetical protein